MKKIKKIKAVGNKSFPIELVSSFAECIKTKWNEKLYEAFEIERSKYLGEFKNDRLEQAKLVVELSRLSPTTNTKQSDKSHEKTKEKEENKNEELAGGPCALQESGADEGQKETPIAETLPELETKEIK